MRKVINGKVYDTDTADCIESSSGGNGHRDFRWYEEELYETKRGAFFLAGSGGPLSRYAHQLPDGCYEDGSNIIPLSTEEVLRWCEKEDIYPSFLEEQIEEA